MLNGLIGPSKSGAGSFAHHTESSSALSPPVADAGIIGDRIRPSCEVLTELAGYEMATPRALDVGKKTAFSIGSILLCIGLAGLALRFIGPSPGYLSKLLMAPDSPRPYMFSEDFEGYELGSKLKYTDSDMFEWQGGPWHQYLGSGKNYRAQLNVFEVTDGRAFSGKQSFHFRVFQEDIDGARAAGGNAIKNSLIKGEWVTRGGFGDGEVVSIVTHMYLPSETNGWAVTGEGKSPRLLDVGARYVANVAEIRVSTTGPKNSVSINRKSFFEPPRTPYDILDDPGMRLPTDRWFKLELRFKVGKLPEDDPVNYQSVGRHPPGRGAYPFDANAPAWFQVVLDDTVIMSNSATTRGGDFNDGTLVDSFEFGLSITASPAELYLDDVAIQDVTGPFTGP